MVSNEARHARHVFSGEDGDLRAKETVERLVEQVEATGLRRRDAERAVAVVLREMTKPENSPRNWMPGAWMYLDLLWVADQIEESAS